MKSAIDNSFCILCRLSISVLNDDTTALFDYDSECQWNDNKFNLSAFCEKCA
jgi:hypothetical protein